MVLNKARVSKDRVHLFGDIIFAEAKHGNNAVAKEQLTRLERKVLWIVDDPEATLSEFDIRIIKQYVY